MTPWQEGYVDGGAIAWFRFKGHKPDRKKRVFSNPEYQADYDDGFEFGWNEETADLRDLEMRRAEKCPR